MNEQRSRDFPQVAWDARVEADLRQLVRLALREDLGDGQDWTTACLVPDAACGAARLVARAPGVVAGLPVGPVVLDEMHGQVAWQPLVPEAARVPAGTAIARLQGRACDILTAERTLLNILGHLSGVATLTAQFVEAVAGTSAAIYDTRKTLPGWRSLEKYAVRCGGGRNHRWGLHAAILIKDNHLAFGRSAETQAPFSVPEALQRARACVAGLPSSDGPLLVEIEVDTWEQFVTALAESPDIVMLDNMPAARLREAVAWRDAHAPQVALEASGGIRLDSVRQLAETGIDRISVGALTHSAANWDLGLDWEDAAA